MGVLRGLLCILMIMKACGFMKAAVGRVWGLNRPSIKSGVLEWAGGMRYSTRRRNGDGGDYDYDGQARSFPRVRREGMSRDDGHRGGGGNGGRRYERSSDRGGNQGVERRGENRGRMRIDFRDGREGQEEKREKPYGEYDGDHLYGVSPVKAALSTDRRNVEELLVQEGMKLDAKKDSKGAAEILALAKKKGVPIREFPKHDLNMLSDNRPHQGFILRASPLRFKRLESSKALSPQALPGSTEEETTGRSKIVLALDEVWDPQNFGALLRTAHFLPGVAEVVVCAKNSAPLSETVSKASAGAMESMEVCSVDNMMRFLDNSIAEGWHVVGTSLGEGSMLMSEIPKDRPTILVLGNEGHGIRTNVLRKCSHLVRIEGGQSEDSVDSLNVSVTGGIMLHFLST